VVEVLELVVDELVVVLRVLAVVEVLELVVDELVVVDIVL